MRLTQTQKAEKIREIMAITPRKDRFKAARSAGLVAEILNEEKKIPFSRFKVKMRRTSRASRKLTCTSSIYLGISLIQSNNGSVYFT